MLKIRENVKYNTPFLLPYLLFLVVTAPFLILFSKQSIHLAINQVNSEFFDFFFKNITHLGDGATPFILAGIFLFISFRRTLQISLSGAVAGISAQFLKRIVFSDFQRPYAYFQETAGFHFVEGVDMHSSFSFPSGHSTTIFSLCFCFALMTKNKCLKTCMLLIALLVAFSRVYLSQHFLMDIYAGSLLGVIITFPLFYLIQNNQSNWLNTSLIQLIKTSRKSG